MKGTWANKSYYSSSNSLRLRATVNAFSSDDCGCLSEAQNILLRLPCTAPLQSSSDIVKPRVHSFLDEHGRRTFHVPRDPREPAQINYLVDLDPPAHQFAANHSQFAQDNGQAAPVRLC
jgi:hypothetical protein